MEEYREKSCHMAKYSVNNFAVHAGGADTSLRGSRPELEACSADVLYAIVRTSL